MAYDEGLAQRVREIFHETPGVEEKKMFGGLVFLVEGHMCVGVSGKNNALLARVGPEQFGAALEKPRVRPMVNGRGTMKGFVFVEPDSVAEDEDLLYWVELCREYVSTLSPK